MSSPSSSRAPVWSAKPHERLSPAGEQGLRRPCRWAIIENKLWFFTGGNYFHREETQPGTDPRLLPGRRGSTTALPGTWTGGSPTRIMFKQRLFNAIWERPEGPGLSQENRTGLTVAAPFETIIKSGGKVLFDARARSGHHPVAQHAATSAIPGHGTRISTESVSGDSRNGISEVTPAQGSRAAA